MEQHSIAILDFGSQYTHLIRRCITELGVRAEVLSPSHPGRDLRGFSGIILSGGPASVYDPACPECDPELFSLESPMLGICYGHQLMAERLGGKVLHGTHGEYGKAQLEIHEQDDILKGLQHLEQVWMSHGDAVALAPQGFVVLASTEQCAVACMANPENHRYGLQFHPEVEHTSQGTRILQNFVFDICGCQPSYSTQALVEHLTEQIRQQVGEHKVFLLVSGGIDSTVTFVLLTRALGQERVYGLHMNTGLLREGETERVVASLTEFGLTNFHVVDASGEFLDNLRGTIDPEEKRKIIASTFLEVKDRAMSRLQLDPHEWLLSQGTIYPDLITSGVTEHSHTIKTHHNSLLKERSDFTIIEPLSMLYKDEVRRIGLELGLPTEFVWQEPFPGPGIAIRILGELTVDKIRLQRQVDQIMDECLRPTPWYRDLWHKFPVIAVVSEFEEPTLRQSVLGRFTQNRLGLAKRANRIVDRVLRDHRLEYDEARCVLLPLRTVGIKGDARSYEAPLAIMISRDGTWARPPYAVLEQLSSRLTSGVPGVNRAIYDITPQAESQSMNVFAVLRLITSRDAMTADWAKLEYPLLGKISSRVVAETRVDRVMLDVTQKPPGMMEWE